MSGAWLRTVGIVHTPIDGIDHNPGPVGDLIVDRLGVRVLRDPYSVKGQVSFYTTKRTGGNVQFFDAAVFLKFGTS